MLHGDCFTNVVWFDKSRRRSKNGVPNVTFKSKLSSLQLRTTNRNCDTLQAPAYLAGYAARKRDCVGLLAFPPPIRRAGCPLTATAFLLEVPAGLRVLHPAHFFIGVFFSSPS